MKKITLTLLIVCCTLLLHAQNIGIGTTTPAYPLTVIADANSKGITQKNGTIELGFYTSGTEAYVQTWSAHNLNFATGNGSPKITIANSNNFVGINTTAPLAQLDVNGTFRLRGNGALAGKVLTTDASGYATWQNTSLTLPFTGTYTGTATNTVFDLTATGSGVQAASFSINNTSSNEVALYGGTNGSGAGIRGYTNGTANAGWFTNFNTANTSPALLCYSNGTGGAIEAESSSSTKNIAIFSNNNGRVARIDGTGKGYFNGGTQTSGADVAEAFAVEGNRVAYEPGDVLVISTTADRTVTKSSVPYSSLVAGVYATKPGMLLTERLETESQEDLVPMGVVGVIPTKVCSEGGAIHRGDLLVTSSKPGYAMKGAKGKIEIGTVIGKSLEDFTGTTGLIKVLVNTR